MARAQFEKPIALLRQLLLLVFAAGLLHAGLILAVAHVPGLLGSGLAGPALLYLALVAASVLCVRGWKAIAHRRAVARYAERVGELERQSRLVDFKSRMEARAVEATSTVRLEKEVNRRDRRVQKAGESKLAALRRQSTLEAIQRELEYYKREHQRLHQENRWLKSSLRQNHIDLAYLKEHVDRFLACAPLTLLARVRSLFTLSSPSPAIIKLARALDGRASHQPVREPDGPFVPAR